MEPETRPQDKFEYYSYILFYVDVIMCIHHSSDVSLEKLHGYMLLKPELVGEPNKHLGKKLKLIQLHDVIMSLSMSPSKCVQEVIRTCIAYVAENFSKD